MVHKPVDRLTLKDRREMPGRLGMARVDAS